jgi:cephalosporin hydroxylase
MRIQIDTHQGTLCIEDENGGERIEPLYSAEAFRLVSSVWIKQEWNRLHWQSFSWFGLPIYQFPDDLLRLQEVVVAVKPEVIIETGIWQGGSVLFFATLCRLLGKGRVISVDIHIPAGLRSHIENGPFADLITLIEGDSSDPAIIERVHALAGKPQSAFVFLDSDHSKAHVRRELEAYCDLVAPGSYIVAADGVMESLVDTPLGQPEWDLDNPAAAAREFVVEHPEFQIRRPRALHGEEHVVDELTYWPDAWLYRTPN